MFTAKVVSKDLYNGAPRVFVQFTDGVTTVEESCIPQNLDGFKFWVRSRLETFNTKDALDTEYPINTIVGVTDPVIPPPTPTQGEIDLKEWLNDYQKWIKVKTTLIDTGILTGNETAVAALKTKVQTNFKAAYVQYL